MFRPEQILGAVLQEALGSSLGVRRRSSYRTYRSGANRAIGMGLLGLAVGAFEHFTKGNTQNSAHPTPPPLPTSLPPSTPPPAPQAASADPAVLALRAMLAAAASDGAIDGTEKQRITQRISGAGLSEEEQGFVLREMEQPLSTAELLGQIASANLNPEIKEQVFLAALIAVDIDTEKERAFFRDLAQGLDLTKTQVSALKHSLGISEEI